MPDTDHEPDVTVLSGLARAAAEEAALVVAAEGLSPAVRRGAVGFSLTVPAGELERAATSIARYRSENPAAAKEPEHESTAEPSAAGLGAATVLLMFYGVAGPRRDGVVWFDQGAANAEKILAGEYWRCVTALTLHADLGHLFGNALIGAFFVSAVGRTFGWGVGSALVLASGALGNFLNAAMYGSVHYSVGASTAVFGAVGVLSGHALVRRGRRGERGRRRYLVPVAAGLGLLAMLGTTGERVDIWAHLYGFLAGLGLGRIAAGALPTGVRTATQWLAGGASAAVLAASWQLALR